MLPLLLTISYERKQFDTLRALDADVKVEVDIYERISRSSQRKVKSRCGCGKRERNWRLRLRELSVCARRRQSIESLDQELV